MNNNIGCKVADIFPLGEILASREFRFSLVPEFEELKVPCGFMIGAKAAVVLP